MKFKKTLSLAVAFVMLIGLCGAFASAVDAKYTVSEPDAQGII
jgi:hypothetical protein